MLALAALHIDRVPVESFFEEDVEESVWELFGISPNDDLFSVPRIKHKLSHIDYLVRALIMIDSSSRLP